MTSVFTGVSAHISAAHTSPEGAVHGHTWNIRAWWPAGDDARELRARLLHALEPLDHSTLPPALASGEALAQFIGEGLQCSEVEIAREAEGYFARWCA